MVILFSVTQFCVINAEKRLKYISLNRDVFINEAKLYNRNPITELITAYKIHILNEACYASQDMVSILISFIYLLPEWTWFWKEIQYISFCNNDTQRVILSTCVFRAGTQTRFVGNWHDSLLQLKKHRWYTYLNCYKDRY